MGNERCKYNNDDCSDFYTAKDMCRVHYKRFNKYGDALTAKGRRAPRPRVNVTCKISGCDTPAQAKQLCPRHYRLSRLLDRVKITLRCAIDDDSCSRSSNRLVKGLCLSHYYRLHGKKLARSIRVVKTEGPRVSCSVVGCGRPQYLKELCAPHYNRHRTHGSLYTATTCVIRNGECAQPATILADNYCYVHYWRKELFGSPDKHWSIDPRHLLASYKLMHNAAQDS